MDGACDFCYLIGMQSKRLFWLCWTQGLQ